MTTLEICEAINMAVPILCTIVGAAILALLYNWWNNKKTEKKEQQALQEYKERLSNRSRHVPFQPQFIPGRL